MRKLLAYSEAEKLQLIKAARMTVTLCRIDQNSGIETIKETANDAGRSRDFRAGAMAANVPSAGMTPCGVSAPFCRPSFNRRSELCGAIEVMEMKCTARGRHMSTRSIDPSEIKILRCPYCGDESRATSGWVRSHMTFQCDACGEQVGLRETKIRKAFHAVRRKLGEITGW